MAFDWIGFLRSTRIHFVTSGKNVAKGHVGVKCPFCGMADPSQHMGIELATGYWGCLRDSGHRGKRPERLMVALTGMRWRDAQELVAQDSPLELQSLHDLGRRLNGLGRKSEVSLLKKLTPPSHFQELSPKGVRDRFWEYLKGRGFPSRDIEEVCKQYKLKCALVGQESNRLIFPFIRCGSWYGWTARSVFKNAKLRYVSHPDSRAVKQVLFNCDGIMKGGRALVVVEGPLDAVKVDFYAQRFGVRAVPLLGTTATPEQVALLLRFGPRFDHVFTLLDPGALGQALALQSQLSLLRPRTLFVPSSAEDPGALSPRNVKEFTREHILPLC